MWEETELYVSGYFLVVIFYYTICFGQGLGLAFRNWAWSKCRPVIFLTC